MPEQTNTEQDSDRQPAPARFTIFHCIGLIVLWGLLQAFILLFLSKLGHDPLKNPDWKDIALISGVSGFLTAQAGAILGGFSLIEMLSARFRPLILVPLILSLLGLSILSSELSNLMQKIQPLPQEVDLYNKLIQQNLFGILIAISVVVPLSEELIFRGIMLEGLAEHYPLSTVYFVSALLFGVSHIHPWLIINAFLLGLFLNWIKISTGSILTCILFHSLFNGLPFLFERVIHLRIPGYTGPITGGIQFQPLWFDLFGVLLFAAGVAGIRLLSKPFSRLETATHNAGGGQAQ